MCTPKRCLPFSFNNFHSFCHRSSPSKRKHNHQSQIIQNPININYASEDELLLIPGIDRLLAKNIIDYRETHDGFKEIDEILQVDGMNSNLFENISSDLITNLPLNNKKELIDLNLALHDELCSVAGLTPNLVKRIIQHRDRKGFFRSVEDLLKIKGINVSIFETIQPYVMVNPQQLRTSISNPSLNNLHSILNRNDTTARDTLSIVSVVLETLPTEFQAKLITSLSSRPSSFIHNNNNNNNKRRNSFRFASWNLQQLTNEKIQNPGVREVICRVILENNFSMIGVQEIGSRESLNLIVQELNNPTIPSIKNWPNRYHGKWKFIISDINSDLQDSQYLGFLYDESIGIELKKASALPFKIYFNQLPFIAIFRIFKRIELVFVNVRFQKQELVEDEGEKKDEAKSLSVLAQAMKNTIEQQHVIIFGDFDNIPIATEFQGLVRCNYSYVFQQNTDIDLNEPQGTICLDNIWLSEQAKDLSKGNSGVIRDNLTSIWIPTGWTWGGLVSNHCPIWIELDLS